MFFHHITNRGTELIFSLSTPSQFINAFKLSSSYRLACSTKSASATLFTCWALQDISPSLARIVHLVLRLDVEVNLRNEMKAKCHHCASSETVKNGSNRECNVTIVRVVVGLFSSNGLRTSHEKKEQALEVYLNSVGIRKITRFLEVSPTSVLNWIKKFSLKEESPTKKQSEERQDCIEMDEIYTFVKKRGKSSCLDGLFS